MAVTVEQVAIVCHEANRAYCATLGDISQLAWQDAPQWQRDSAISGVRFHFEKIDNGEKPSPSASHVEWLRVKSDEGWKYGPVKDADKKEHPCFLPYDQLPAEQQMKDFIFAGICEAMHG